jgi:predicted dehydrogenase
MIKVGLIGCGEHSETGHAVPLARYKAAHPTEIELAAACDPNLARANAFCASHGFSRAYSNADAMLAREKFDVCIAVVPVEKISALGIQLLEMGMPCVVEKPLGASLSDAQALVAAAKASRTPNMVSVNRRFMPFLNRAIEWSRRAGPLRYVRGTMSRHARGEREFLWTTAVHAVDALRHVAGEVAEGNIRTLRQSGSSADWFAIDLRFENGAFGHIDVLPTAGVLEETYELFGEGYCVTVTCPFGAQRRWRVFQENKLVFDESAPPEMPEDVVNGCYDEAAALFGALARGQRPSPSIEAVFPSVELCLAMAKTVEKTKT